MTAHKWLCHDKVCTSIDIDDDDDDSDNDDDDDEEGDADEDYVEAEFVAMMKCKRLFICESFMIERRVRT